MDLHPKVVMCFFDSSPDENVVMQYFMKIGAITITNQHGQNVFESTEYDRLNQSQLLNFKCDYYFAKGFKQKEQLMLAGVSEQRIKLIGVVGKERNEECKIANCNDKVVIGVYLDCPLYIFAEKTNMEMIGVVKKVALKEGFKYFIKPHPLDDLEKYRSIL